MCEYELPPWWNSTEQRKNHKEIIKEKIKQTKVDEKNNAAAGTPIDPFSLTNPSLTVGSTAGRRHRGMPMDAPFAPELNFNAPFYPETYDPFASHLPTPAFGPAPFGQFPPYEVDVRTERQLFVNDVQTRVDTSFSTFNTFAPPQLHTGLPQFPDTEWAPTLPATQSMELPGEAGPAFPQPDAQSHSVQMNIEVDEYDRPLLNHFVDNVLRLIFPIVEAHQGGHERAQAVLRSLESNKSYLHCCLSVSATHLKSTIGIEGEEIDNDILRHRFEAVTHLCQALNENTEHEKILEATLAMIFFHCSVGGPDDYLPDIAWNDHFQAATSLINKLGLPNALLQSNTPFEQAPFDMTLASWIDILGATMLGKSPQFAHAYRTKHLSGTSSGLRELMGCDDRVMYLISEIACLDALRSEGLIDDMAVCSHVSALGQQLKYTEPANPALEDPYNPINGAVRPDQLTKSITTIFRFAARIYLCSLVPGFDRSQASNTNLVDAVCQALQYIPSGPNGYDRSLVWPLLITGIYSVPTSPFRQILQERVLAMGDYAEFGSFGRVHRLLQEVWRRTDDGLITPAPTRVSFDLQANQDAFSSPQLGTPPTTQHNVHWRDIMQQNGWKYLLI